MGMGSEEAENYCKRREKMEGTSFRVISTLFFACVFLVKIIQQPLKLSAFMATV